MSIPSWTLVIFAESGRHSHCRCLYRWSWRDCTATGRREGSPLMLRNIVLQISWLQLWRQGDFRGRRRGASGWQGSRYASRRRDLCLLCLELLELGRRKMVISAIWRAMLARQLTHLLFSTSGLCSTLGRLSFSVSHFLQAGHGVTRTKNTLHCRT